MTKNWVLVKYRIMKFCMKKQTYYLFCLHCYCFVLLAVLPIV